MRFKDTLKRYAALSESSVKLDAIKNMKSIQAQLTTISFLDVLSVMAEDNPLKSKVEAFERTLTELRVDIEQFVHDNQYDATDPEDNMDPVEPKQVDKKDEKKDADKKPADKKDKQS